MDRVEYVAAIERTFIRRYLNASDICIRSRRLEELGVSVDQRVPDEQNNPPDTGAHLVYVRHLMAGETSIELRGSEFPLRHDEISEPRESLLIMISVEFRVIADLEEDDDDLGDSHLLRDRNPKTIQNVSCVSYRNVSYRRSNIRCVRVQADTGARNSEAPVSSRPSRGYLDRG